MMPRRSSPNSDFSAPADLIRASRTPSVHSAASAANVTALSAESDPALLAQLARLSNRITAELPPEGDHVLIAEGVKLIRRDRCGVKHAAVARPSIALVTAGEKSAMMLGTRWSYGCGAVFICGVDLPDSFTVTKASPAKPLLGLAVDLEETDVERALARLPERTAEAGRPHSIFLADSGLVGAFERLLDLRGSDAASKALAGLVREEIAVRILASQGGRALRTLFQTGTIENRIRRSALWMRSHFRESFEISDLAQTVGMSPATFYRHFKTVLTVSPRQYVKTLRLYEGRRLMIEHGLDVARASYEVGYESPNHFSREFKREFGDAPAKHVREAVSVLDGAPVPETVPAAA